MGMMNYLEWAFIMICGLAYGIVGSYVYVRSHEFAYPLWYVVASIPFVVYIWYRSMGPQGNEMYTARLKNLFYSIGIVVLCMLLGYIRTEIVHGHYDDTDHFYNKVKGRYTVEIASRPEVIKREDSTKLRFLGKAYTLLPYENSYATVMPIHGSILCYLDIDQLDGGVQEKIRKGNFLYKGDVVELEGRATRLQVHDQYGYIMMMPRHISNLRHMTIYDGIYKKTIDISDQSIKGTIHRWWKGVIRQGQIIRQHVENVLRTHLDDDVAELGISLLLGASYESLDTAIVDAFSKTGVIHILSISGSHIALLFGLFYALLHKLFCRRTYAILISLGLVMLYCAIVGWDPPVVRAAFMGTMAGLGWIRGRLYNALQGVNIAMICMLLWNPLFLFDISFQLSMSATYGILLWGKPIYELFPKGYRILCSPIALTMSAQLLMLPLQLYYFHLWGFGTLLASIFVTPLLDLSILILVLCTAFQIVWLPSIVWGLLSLLLKIALFLCFGISKIPYSYMWLGILPIGITVAYIMVAGAFQYALSCRVGREAVYIKKLYVGAMICLIIGGILYVRWHPFTVVYPLYNKGKAAFTVIHRGKKNYSLVYIDATQTMIDTYIIQGVLKSLHMYGITKIDGYMVDGITKENREGVVNLVRQLDKSNSHKVPLGGQLFELPLHDLIKGHMGDGNTNLQIQGTHGLYQFSNGQKMEKSIQLNYKEKNVLGMTSEEVAVILLNGDQKGRILLWTPRTSRTDIDYDAEGIHAVGRENVGPMEI